VILFNAANAPLLPALRARGLPVATHVDGLEWKRAKWGGAGRRYYRAAEALAVRWSDALIADAAGIQDYYREEFAAPTELIRYGAPRVTPGDPAVLAPLGVRPGRYHLVVARFEPENHIDLIVDGYCASAAEDPLVVVGAAPHAADYTARVHRSADERVRFLGSLWDQDLLDQLYANCLTYQHGHSVGGTNPSLLRAIGAGAATDAFDVDFNREVLGDAGRYWSTADDVAALVLDAEADRAGTRARGEAGRRRAARYDWDEVAADYEKLCRRLATGAQRRPRHVTGRRTGLDPRSLSATEAVPTEDR
jgi:glycosyltransferase involved in cell wall biosynthesis